jgi:pimeloyl-ACP methyl ester carboxylesterase
VDGVRIFTRRAGGGAPDHGRARALPIVLVHGYGGSSDYLLPTARALARTHPTYALDLPGFGRSSHPPQPLGAPALAAILAAWARALALGPALFVGNSFGCQVLAHLAVRAPELVAGVVLTGPTLDPAAHALPRLLWRFLRDIPREPVSLVPVVARSFLVMGPAPLVKTLGYLRKDDIEQTAARMRVPTLVVCGEHDPLAPPTWGARLARAVPGAEHVLVPGAPHALPYSRPKALARVIQAFSQRIEAEERHTEPTLAEEQVS